MTLSALLALIVGCSSRPYLPMGHEGGATTPYPLTYTKQADNPGLRYGMYYNLANYEHCLRLYKTPPGKSMAGCEYLRLTRPDIPEYWPDGTPPPIQYPPPPAEPTYKPGMTSEQYFNALCEKESGDFIFRTVQDVDGFYLIRPRYYQGDQIRRELFANEAPYMGFYDLEVGIYGFLQFARDYRYVEIPAVSNYPAHYIPSRIDSDSTRPHFRDRPGSGQYWRFWWDDEIDRHARQPTPSYYRQPVSMPQSRYGITWRAIERTGFDRDLGVAGAEALIVDLNSGEVLAVRRGFIRAIMAKPAPLHGHTGYGWNRNWECPDWAGARRSSSTAKSLTDFILKVLVPVPARIKPPKEN